MFHTIPDSVRERMRSLERLDAGDRADGSSRAHRLRQIPPETGRFISLLARCAPDGTFVEIGTSGGYSALWLGLACREGGRVLTTIEIAAEKIEIARETFRDAGMLDIVRLVHGDALDVLAGLEGIAFCFLDAEKEIYPECYELVVARMVPGAILVADNAISHATQLRSMLDRVMDDPRVDAVIVPIGSGELVCRRL
jgi:caffeoyl-CoA O-methyltransferase